MYIQEVVKSGEPFAHPDMIGAFRFIVSKGYMVHCDHIEDARHMGDDHERVNEQHTAWCINCLTPNDLIRDDWYIC